MSGSNYCFLTCIQVSQEFGKVVWYSHLFKNFLQFGVDHNKLWKILKEMGVPAHLTYLLRNLYVGQEIIEPDMEQLTCSRLGKEYQGCILSPCLFNLYAEYIM